jgi:SAM-dependent methyltransferase
MAVRGSVRRGQFVGRMRDRVRFAGREVRCPCCDGRFGRFKLSGGGQAELECPRCGSRQRHRLLWLFLNAERLLADRGLRILHLEPEPCIEQRLRSLDGVHYVAAGIESPLADVRAEVTELPFEDASFDRILCSYVLERTSDDSRAMAELRRVLAPGGLAVIQSAVSRDLSRTVEAGGLRACGTDVEECLRRTGFRVQTLAYAEEMDRSAAERHGVAPGYGALRNDLHLCEHPA